MLIPLCILGALLPQSAVRIPNVPPHAPSVPAPHFTQTPRSDFWVTNGTVNSVAIDGDTAFVGGLFNTVGRFTGPLALLDPVTGRSFAHRAKLQGIVRAVCDDGLGGWFVAGTFTEGITGEQSLLWIHGDGTPEALSPLGLTLGIDVLLREGSTLYIGGRFSSLLGGARAGLAAFDIASRTLLPFDPLAVQVFADQNAVRALALVGGELLVGGDLDLGTLPQGPFLLGVDAATGAIVWQPTLDAPVNALEVDAQSIYVGGQFTSAELAARARVAVFRRGDRALEPFAADFDNEVQALLVHGGALFAAGRFLNVGTAARVTLASFDLATGTLLPWDPTPEFANGVQREVKQLASVGGAVLAGGRFVKVDGVWRRMLVLLDPVTGAALDLPAHLVGQGNTYVECIAEGGGRLAIGGRFETVGEVFATGLAALDLRTGRCVPGFAPSLFGGTVVPSPAGVLSVVVRGDTLYVAGSMSTVDGVTRKRIAALDKHTGRLIPTFDAGLNSPSNNFTIEAMEVANDRIYLIGEFDPLTPQQIDFIAVDIQTGQLIPTFQPIIDTRAWALELSTDAQTIYVGGQDIVAGPAFEARDRLAAFDAFTGALLPFNPGANDVVRTLLAMPDRLWVGGHFNQLAGQIRDGLGAIDLVTGAALPFESHCAGGVPGGAITLCLDGTSLLAGGTFGTAGTPPTWQLRNNLALFDERSGALGAWNPVCGNEVNSIATNANVAVVGGAFRGHNNLIRPHLFVFWRSP